MEKTDFIRIEEIEPSSQLNQMTSESIVSVDEIHIEIESTSQSEGKNPSECGSKSEVEIVEKCDFNVNGESKRNQSKKNKLEMKALGKNKKERKVMKENLKANVANIEKPGKVKKPKGKQNKCSNDEVGSTDIAQNAYDIVELLFFKKYATRLIDSDNSKYGYLSEQDSIFRLQWIALLIGYGLAIISTILTSLGLYYQLSQNLPIILIPEIKQETQLEQQGVPHIALIYEDGSVYDYSTQPNISPPQGLLIKLPKFEQKSYFGYSDELGSLYFMDGSLTKLITQYNKKNFKIGHHTIPNSKNQLIDSLYRIDGSNTKLNTQYGKNMFIHGHNTNSNSKHQLKDLKGHFTHGIQVGDLFWVWGHSYESFKTVSNTLNNLNCRIEDGLCTVTYVWYIKRKIWRKGPTLPNYLAPQWEAVSINRTAVLFVGAYLKKSLDIGEYEHDYIGEIRNGTNFVPDDTLTSLQRYTAVFDFESEQWQIYPSVFEDFPEHVVHSYSLAVQITKSTKTIYACIQSYDSGYLSRQVTLQSYDLKNGAMGVWQTLNTERFSTNELVSKIFITNGKLYATHSLGNIPIEDIKAHNKGENGDIYNLVNTVPYLVYK